MPDEILDDYRALLAPAWAEARAIDTVVDVCAPFRKWINDPIGWATEVAKERLWRFERVFLESVRDNPKTALRCCRKCGKTHTLGILCPWFFCTRVALVITMSSKQDALESQLWPRFSKIKARATIPLPGKLGVLQWKISPGHKIIGLAASDEGAVRGFHSGADIPDDPDAWEQQTSEEIEAATVAKLEEIKSLGLEHVASGDSNWLLVILDEVQTIDDRIIQAFQGSIQGPRVRLVLSGNPLMAPDANHELARSHKRGSGYYRIKVAAYKADEELDADAEFDRVPPYLLDEKWIGERREAWGEDSPLFRSDVLGQFSSHALPNQFVTLAILRQAAAREKGWKFELDVKRRHLGWDVAASESGDDNVLSFWDCGCLVHEEVWKEDDAIKSAELVLRKAEWFGIHDPRTGKTDPVPGRNIHVDASGIGKVAAQYMRSQGVRVDAVDVGAAPIGEWPRLCAEMAFDIRKPELIWVFRRALQTGLACVPERFEKVWQQAQWYSYEPAPRRGGSVIRVKESKDDLQRLHGRSPDNFEAAYLAWSRSSTGPIVTVT